MNLEREDFSECPACEEGEQEGEPHVHRLHSRRKVGARRVPMDHAGSVPASGRAETLCGDDPGGGDLRLLLGSALHDGPATGAMSGSPRRGAFAVVCLLSWFFYAYPAEYFLWTRSDQVAAAVVKHGPFAMLLTCEQRARELESWTRWRLRAGPCWPVVAPTDENHGGRR